MKACSLKVLTVGLVISGLALPACVTAGTYRSLQDELGRTQDDLAMSSSQLRDAEDMLVDAEGRQNSLMQQAAMADQLAARNAELEAQVAALKQKGAISTPDGTMLFTSDGKYGWRADGDVVFAPGSDKLTKDGERILKDIAGQLQRHSQPVSVWGHTDSDPVKKTIELWPRGNMQLGAGRALTVYEYLVKQGVDEKRLSVTSYGPHRPVASGNSSAAKSKNRRVEIMTQVEQGQ